MVIRMRRLVTALVVLALSALALLGGPTVATAAPRSVPAGPPCPGSTLYPPGPDATIMSSTTTPFIGQKIEASGIKYCPNEDVTLTISGKFVGTAHTNGDGTFDPLVTVPGPTGDKPLCGIGASGLLHDRDCLTLHVRAEGTNGGGTPLGTTGVEIATIVAVALVLLGGGVLFVAAGRRRKSSHV
jgi:hypothetical protein